MIAEIGRASTKSRFAVPILYYHEDCVWLTPPCIRLWVGTALDNFCSKSKILIFFIL